MDFLKPKIEKSIENTLPGVKASIARVDATYNKGIVIEGLALSSGGQTILKVKEISFDYGSLGILTSSVFFKKLSSSAEIEIRGLEAFLSRETRKLFSSQHISKPQKTPEPSDGEQTGTLTRLPTIKIRNSVLQTQTGTISVHRSELSFSRGEDDGELKIILKKGHLTLPESNLSAKNLSLTSTFLTADGFGVESLDGNGFLETSRGNAQVRFGVSMPAKVSSPLWEGWLSLSGISLLNRDGKASFNSISLSKDGVFSIRGDVSLGGLSSKVKATLNAGGGGWLPRLREKNSFEIENDIFRIYDSGRDDSLALGGLKVVGSIWKKNGNLLITGKLPADNRLNPFEAGKPLEKSAFDISLTDYNVDSGNLLVKSPNLFIKAGLRTPDGRTEVKYKIESKNIFYLARTTRALKKYGMSGEVRSSGKLERRGDGKLFLSAEAAVEDFSALLRKKTLRIENGEMDLKIPVENFSFENGFVKSSFKNISYGTMDAEKMEFGIDKDTRAELKFKDGGHFLFVADIRRENGKLSAEVKKAEFKTNNSQMSLFRNFTASVSRRKAEIENLVLYGEKSHLHFSGLYEFGEKGRDLNMSARFSGFDTELFEYFYPSLHKHRGVLSGRIDLDGTANWPAADIDLKYQSVSGQTAGALSVFRPVSSDRLSLNLSAENSGGFLKITGGVSSGNKKNPEIKNLLKDFSNYDLTLKAEKFSVKPFGFLSNKIQNLDGVFSGELSVFSDSGTPDINGAIDIENARVRIEPWTELMEIESAQTVFDKDTISSSVRTRDSFGKAGAKGKFNIRDFSYSYEAMLEGIHLRIKHLHSGFYGKVFVNGSGRNIRVKGKDLKTKGASIWIKRDYNIAVGDLVFVDSPGNGKEDEFSKGKQTGFFALTSDLDFHLYISGDTKFTLDNVDSLLEGDLRILRKPGDNFSTATGKLNLLRGSYSVLGKQFVIDKGSVSLSSRAHLSPIVDINAFYRISGLSVKANLYGEANNLKLQLSSVPAMEEDEIILALLTKNKNGDNRALDILKTVRGERSVENTAFGYAADELVSSVLESSSLFTFVDVFSISREGAGIFESEIEVGTYITDRLYLSYERISEIFLISSSYQSRFTAEYDLSKHFVIEAIAGGTTPGVNFLFNVDFR